MTEQISDGVADAEPIASMEDIDHRNHCSFVLQVCFSAIRLPLSILLDLAMLRFIFRFHLVMQPITV